MNLSESYKADIKRLAGINEALKTQCQTPGVTYDISISDKDISVKIEMPKELSLDKKEAALLENNIHNALELVLARYFK